MQDKLATEQHHIHPSMLRRFQKKLFGFRVHVHVRKHLHQGLGVLHCLHLPENLHPHPANGVVLVGQQLGHGLCKVARRDANVAQDACAPETKRCPLDKIIRLQTEVKCKK